MAFLRKARAQTSSIKRSKKLKTEKKFLNMKNSKWERLLKVKLLEQAESNSKTPGSWRTRKTTTTASIGEKHSRSFCKKYLARAAALRHYEPKYNEKAYSVFLYLSLNSERQKREQKHLNKPRELARLWEVNWRLETHNSVCSNV